MSKLLKGGIVLIHGEGDKVTPTKTDVLIQEDRIVSLANDVSVPPDCEVIDCTGKIISPGFVDAHHHLWQTMLKGMYGDSQFLEYLAGINALATKLTPQDVFWGNLSGCLEALDAGTTTVLDHAHLNWTPKHSKAAIGGTLSSGIRSIFAYSPVFRMKSIKPIEIDEELFPAWVMDELESLSKTPALSDPASRVKLGFGFDFWFLPKGFVLGLFEKIRSWGIETVTTHNVRWSNKTESLVKKAHEYGLLDRRLIFSHAGGASQEDIDLLIQSDSYVAVTPNTEQAMCVGPSVCFNKDLVGGDKVSALGIDCHCATSSNIVNEMRLALQSARGLDSAEHRRNGTTPYVSFHTSDEAFNLGTIQGARALNMEKDIGSIAVGKKADLVIFDTLTPAMLAAAQKAPVMAIVLHSSVADVDAVLVDGEFRKRDGKLVDVALVDWETQGTFTSKGSSSSWRDVGRELLAVQEKVDEVLPNLNLVEVEESFKQKFAHF